MIDSYFDPIVIISVIIIFLLLITSIIYPFHTFCVFCIFMPFHDLSQYILSQYFDINISIIKELFIVVLIAGIAIRLILFREDVRLILGPINQLAAVHLIILLIMAGITYTFFKQTSPALIATLRVDVEFLLVIPVVTYLASTYRRIEALMKIQLLLFGLVIVLSIILFQVAGPDTMLGVSTLGAYGTPELRALGPFQFISVYAAFIALVSAYLYGLIVAPVRLTKRGVLWLMFAGTVFLTIYTFSRRAWVSLFTSVLLISIRFNLKQFALVLPLLAVVILLVGNPITRRLETIRLDEPSIASRLEEYSVISENITQRPLFGSGVGSNGPEAVEAGIYNATPVHNNWVFMWTQYGFLGLLSRIALLTGILLIAYRLVSAAPPVAEARFTAALPVGVMALWICAAVIDLFGTTSRAFVNAFQLYLSAGLLDALWRLSRKGYQNIPSLPINSD